MSTNGILRFEPNKPERFAIALTPQECESMYGTKPEWKCTLVDGRIVYLKEAVKVQLDEMSIKTNEPIEVTQTLSQHGQKKIYGWKVRRVEEDQQQPEKNLSSNPPAATVSAMPSDVQAPQSQPSTNGRPSYGRIMAQCWIASIDALITARDYAKAKDLEFRITDESLRCCANSVFIQFFREKEQGR